MCTVTWALDPEGYELFFNRDESRMRGEAHPPEIRVGNGTRYIAPIDSDAGGTWLAVNEHGVTVGLANYYGDDEPVREAPGRDYVSRGLLVLSLAREPAVSDIRHRLFEHQLADYRPFILILLERGSPVITLTWTGEGRSFITDGELHPPITTSARRQQEVRAARRRIFMEATSGGRSLDPEVLERYHKTHLPQKGPLSPCMHREEAATVSLSHISVLRDRIDFRYTPGSPCETPFMSPVSLSRT